MLESRHLDTLALGKSRLPAYDCGIAVGRLIECIRREGYTHRENPVVVTEEGVVVSGYCRILALRWLRDNDPENFRLALPSGLVPVNVVLYLDD